MDLVDYEDLIAVARRRDSDGVDDDFARVLELCISRRIDLLHVYRSRSCNLAARIADAARLGRDALDAVESLGNDPRGRRFSNTARSGEQICVVNPSALQRVAEGLGDHFLSDYLIERLRSEFSGDDV